MARFFGVREPFDKAKLAVRQSAGTLFGRNSIAEAIRVFMRDPTGSSPWLAIAPSIVLHLDHNRFGDVASSLRTLAEYPDFEYAMRDCRCFNETAQLFWISIDDQISRLA